MHILNEACKITSCNLLCGEDGSADPHAREALEVTLRHLRTSLECVADSKVGDCSQLRVLGRQLLFFDLAQSTHSWTKAWHEVVTSPPSALPETLFKLVPALRNVDCADGDAASSRPYLPCLPSTNGDATGYEEAQQQDKQGALERGDGGKHADEELDSKKPILAVESIHRFMHGPGTVALLDESVDAYMMGLDQLDAGFVQQLQSRLQFAVWAAYGTSLRKSRAAAELKLDLSKKGTDAVILTKDEVMTKGLALMFAGHVSMYAQGQLGKDHYPLCTVFGLTFYCNGPKDLSSCDVVVPAWLAKSVARNDLAYFPSESCQEKFILYLTGGDAGMQLQRSADVGSKLRGAMRIHTALASADDDAKKAMISEYEKYLQSVDEAEDAEASETVQDRTRK